MARAEEDKTSGTGLRHQERDPLEQEVRRSALPHVVHSARLHVGSDGVPVVRFGEMGSAGRKALGTGNKVANIVTVKVADVRDAVAVEAEAARARSVKRKHVMLEGVKQIV